MKPKPFESLNHLTVPLTIVTKSFFCRKGGADRFYGGVTEGLPKRDYQKGGIKGCDREVAVLRSNRPTIFKQAHLSLLPLYPIVNSLSNFICFTGSGQFVAKINLSLHTAATLTEKAANE